MYYTILEWFSKVKKSIRVYILGNYRVRKIIVPLDWIDLKGNPIQIDCIMHEVLIKENSAGCFYSEHAAYEYIEADKSINSLLDESKINRN